MFGTLRPALCRLPQAERQAYRRAYCGTCKALGEGYGQLARPLLSYDMVFLAAVIEGSFASASGTSTCRCPLLPILHKEIIDPESPSVQISAAIQVILASAWFDDQVSDGSPAYRPARALARPKADKAHADLAALGFELEAARDLCVRQSSLESQTRDLHQLAGPTSEVLASVLAQVGTMPGAILRNQVERDALKALGNFLGLAIYAVDALEDLEGDVQRSAFNPCIDARGRVRMGAIEEAREVLNQALTGIEQCLDTISFARGEAGIRAAATGLTRRARAAIAASEKTEEEWAALRPRRAPERWLRALWTSLLWLPLWLTSSTRRAVARTRMFARQPMHTKACSSNFAFATQAGGGDGAGSDGPRMPNPITPNQPPKSGGPGGPAGPNPMTPNTQPPKRRAKRRQSTSGTDVCGGICCCTEGCCDCCAGGSDCCAGGSCCDCCSGGCCCGVD